MHSGFCDRLRSITFGIMLSKVFIKNKNSIKLIENKSKECPYLFTDLCEIKKFKIKKLKKNSSLKPLFLMNPFNSEISIKNLIKHLPYKYNNLTKLIDLWKDSYKIIYPKRKVLKKIKKLKLPKKYIGIHIRVTDKLVPLYTQLFEIPTKSTISHLQLRMFNKYLPSMLSKYAKNKNVYIACDDQKTKIKFTNLLNKKGFQVFFNNNKFFKNKFRQTNGEDFVTDLFCLSRAELIVSSTGGGVPLTAQMLSQNKTKIINYNQKKNIFFIIKILNIFIYYLRLNLNKLFMFKIRF